MTYDVTISMIGSPSTVKDGMTADVSIIGFDDIPYARFFSPPLTTVRQDFKALGKVCFAKLLELSNSNRTIPGLEPPQAQLIIRESAGPPPEGPPGAHAKSSPNAGPTIDRADTTRLNTSD